MGAFTDKATTSSFGTLGFFIQQQSGRARPLPGRNARVQRDEIPYGGLNAATIQIGGTDTPPDQITAWVKLADWDTWLAAVGTTGTLTILSRAYGTAVLANVAAGQVQPDGEDAVATTLSFTY